MQQTDPAPGLPSRLVIDAREPLEKFQAVLDKFEELGVELKTALADVISCLSDKEEAHYEIAYTGYEMSPNLVVEVEPTEPQQAGSVTKYNSDGTVTMQICTGEPQRDTIDLQAQEYVNARDELGKALLQLFIDFKLYRHGKLFYQIYDVMGTALVLDKIGVPFLAEERAQQRYVNNLDRQVALRTSLSVGRNREADVPQRPAELFNGLSPEDKARFCAFATAMGSPRRTN